MENMQEMVGQSGFDSVAGELCFLASWSSTNLDTINYSIITLSSTLSLMFVLILKFLSNAYNDDLNGKGRVELWFTQLECCA